MDEVSENNLKSIKSNINCGMKKIGKFPEGFFVKNRYDDVLIFAMTKKEYKDLILEKKILIITNTFFPDRNSAAKLLEELSKESCKKGNRYFSCLCETK